MIDQTNSSKTPRLAQVLGVAAVWMFARWVGWIGLAGADDFDYVEFAVQPRPETSN